MARAYNLDFADNIAVREELLGERERETNISCDLNDFSWFDKIDFKPEDGIIFFAAGVFYYFKTEQVKALFAAMAERFSVDDLDELKSWSSQIKQVIRKGYLTGYRPLDKRYGIVLNSVFKHLDKSNRCQIIEISF